MPGGSPSGSPPAPHNNQTAMKKQIFIIAIAAFGLTSCGVYKSYERPDDLQTDGLYGSVQTGNDTQGTGAMHWRQFFTDATLQELIGKALAQNTNMRQVDLQIQEAQAYLKCSKLAYIPSLVFTPQGQLSSFDWAAPNKTYTLPVTASWQIGSFGQLRNAKKSAEVAVEQVRTVLAEKSVTGHRAEVQALIRECGADKLSAVDPEKYAVLLQKAEVL